MQCSQLGGNFYLEFILDKVNIFCIWLWKTRLHWSRKRTARLLAVSPSMHCAGGYVPGGCLVPGEVSAPGGGCLAKGGVCSWGCLVQGQCLLQGVPASGPRGCVSQHAMGQTPPCEQNHRHV